jgi:hypothetical protein
LFFANGSAIDKTTLLEDVLLLLLWRHTTSSTIKKKEPIAHRVVVLITVVCSSYSRVLQYSEYWLVFSVLTSIVPATVVLLVVPSGAAGW